MDVNSNLQKYITQTALDAGAILVGFTKIRKVEPVIVFGYPYSNLWILNHPFYTNWRFAEELWHGRKVHSKVIQILQKEGYSTNIKSSLSVFGDFRPLAIAAGLGHWGRNGLVVNPNYGSKIIFSALFTNAPFEEISEPLIPMDQSSICSGCTTCIDSCPSKAFEQGHFHPKRCFSKAIRGCSECIQVCPNHL
jgi:epoxyqueuosine reductase